jgi:hypothetical protein
MPADDEKPEDAHAFLHRTDRLKKTACSDLWASRMARTAFAA